MSTDFPNHTIPTTLLFLSSQTSNRSKYEVHTHITRSGDACRHREIYFSLAVDIDDVIDLMHYCYPAGPYHGFQPKRASPNLF